MLRAALLFIGLVVLAAPAWAEPPRISPLATARDIRAGHASRSGEWRLTYSAAGPQGDEAPVVVALASDYVLRQDKGTQIFDFAHARIYSVTPGEGGFANDSLHAMALFRIHELQNRKVLSGALAAAKMDAPPPHLDPFWAECELSMVLPNQAPPVVRREGENTLALWHGESLAARATLGPEAPAALRSKLIRLWRHALPMHPQMARELAATGRAPASLEVPVLGGDRVGLRKLILAKAEWIEPADFPLPETAVPAPERGSPATIAILGAAREAARSGARAPTLDEYVARIKGSLARGASLEAALWSMEAVLAGSADMAAICPTPQNAGEPCQTLRQAFRAGMADPRASVLFAKGPLKKETSLPDLSGLSNAHVGRLLTATRLVMGGGGGAGVENAYQAALGSGPGVVGYYKDIGDYYVRYYQHPTAWRLYDLGRMLPGHRQGDLLSEIDRMEAKLRKDFPELY